METFIICLGVILTFLYNLFPFLLLSSFLSLRSLSFAVRVLAYILFVPIGSVVIYPNDAVNILYAAIAFFLYLQLFYHGHLIEKLSIEMILYPIIVAVNYLSENMGMYLFLYIQVTTSVNASDFIRFIFFCIQILIWFLIWHYYKSMLFCTAKTMTIKMWLIVDTICLASFLGIISTVIFSPDNTYATYPACLAFLITSLSSIYLVSYISKSVRKSFEVQNLKLQQAYYMELEQNQQAIRKLNHDMNNHLNVIGTFIEQDKKDEAREYFKNLSGTLPGSNRRFCQNSIVNAILNSKYNLALQNNIDIFFHIDLEHLLSIDDISLCSIFSNTLDNAIEAASKIEDVSKRKLSVKSRYYNGYFSYEIQNSKVNVIKNKKGRFLTGKTDNRLHGFGIENVTDIVKTYNGTIDISFTDDSFTVIILIGNLI